MQDADKDFAGVSSDAWDELYAKARAAKSNAWVPYSNFPVGAALLTASGEVVSGCNVENASIGATVCAERTAVGNAVCAGDRRFDALCVVTDAEPPAAPCGICRQVLAEFGTDLPILMANERGEREFTTLDDLLPRAFTGLPDEENPHSEGEGDE